MLVTSLENSKEKKKTFAMPLSSCHKMALKCIISEGDKSVIQDTPGFGHLFPFTTTVSLLLTVPLLF